VQIVANTASKQDNRQCPKIQVTNLIHDFTYLCVSESIIDPKGYGYT